MFSGSIVAIVTPMQAAQTSASELSFEPSSEPSSRPSSELERALDLAALRELCDWHIEQGTAGIVVMGTTGESATVSSDNYYLAIETVVKQVAGRVPVIAGTGTISTAKTIEQTNKAAKLGVDAALVVTPYYCKPSQVGLYQHFMALADVSEIPIILYNVPGRPGCDLLPETVARLAEHPKIVAIKEATGDISRVAELKAVCKTPIELLSGDDATCREFIEAGGDGVISVTTNIAPALMSQLCILSKGGQAQQALLVDQKLMGLHRDLFLEANPIPVKWALAQMGKIADAIQLPLTSLDSQFQPAVLQALEQANVKTN